MHGYDSITKSVSRPYRQGYDYGYYALNTGFPLENIIPSADTSDYEEGYADGCKARKVYLLNEMLEGNNDD